ISTTFLPRELIHSKWLLTASWFNPVTYILEANRYLIAGTSSKVFFIAGLMLLLVSSVTSVVFALLSSRKIKV
ncbi:MAG TPA: hypothetical protein VHO90_05830, partial [Bacteroidales bacterium]|nr:hypothetical protein [Bacteroidales bacterium]